MRFRVRSPVPSARAVQARLRGRLLSDRAPSARAADRPSGGGSAWGARVAQHGAGLREPVLVGLTGLAIETFLILGTFPASALSARSAGTRCGATPTRPTARWGLAGLIAVAAAAADVGRHLPAWLV
jgi:hypothetical protein